MRGITTNKMHKEFSKKYVALSNKAVYWHQANGLHLYVYFDDGSYSDYDYVKEKIVSFWFPEEHYNESSIGDGVYSIPFESREELMSNFSKNVKWLLRQKKMTVNELCDRTDVSYNTLRRYINGERFPDVYVGFAIAEALDTTLEYLVS